MTIAATITALQTRHAALVAAETGTAEDRYPESIEASDCPYVIVDAGRAKTSWDGHGGDLAISERIYRVRVFYQPAVMGIDQGKQGAQALLDTFLTSYKDTPTINSTTAILIERDIEDGGVVDTLPYGENTYIGFTILLPVEERDE